MKQILLKKGRLVIDDVPAPVIGKGMILVEVYHSLISSGTESFVVKEGGKSLLKKVFEQPDKLSKLVDHLRKFGLKKTIEVIRWKTGAGLPLGYSCSGVVIGVGEDITEFQIGDMVACAGAGKANHAEIVLVPRNLAVKIPPECDIRDAASVAVGAIALQGVRRAELEVGEIAAVIGLGLIGQITVQLLKAIGCRVIAVDINKRRVERAVAFGADYGFDVSRQNYIDHVRDITEDKGVDAAIITASSSSNTVIQQAMEVTRKKGYVVVVGNVGLGINRSPFYEKEIDLRISCSYGPGRYDPDYEEKGIDYPYPYVRWTERRNMAEYLRLLACKNLNFKEIIEKEFPFSRVKEAYQILQSAEDKPLAVLLSYRSDDGEKKTVSKVELRKRKRIKGEIKIAVVGAGNFARAVHLPNLTSLSDLYHIRAVVDTIGNNAKDVAELFGADYCSTDFNEVLNDEEVDAVLIATRHNLHARQAKAAAEKGKAVFLEKPMALNEEELEELAAVLRRTKVPFMVGFNRRFSPAACRVKSILAMKGIPLTVFYRVNAGHIPTESWIFSEEGGGRIIGEACHMFDFFNYIIGSSEVRDIAATAMNPRKEARNALENFIVSLRYHNGSICSLYYTTVGSKEVPKEYVEIHGGGETLIIDDYKEVVHYGLKIEKWRYRQDKGHRAELIKFGRYVLGEEDAPLSLEEMISATELSFKANRVESETKEN